MDADGRNQRPLTKDPGWEMFIAWSPDDMQIAFFTCDPQCCPKQQDFYVMNADGSNVWQSCFALSTVLATFGPGRATPGLIFSM
jgi:Tol biopolymer transport system component